MTAQEYIDACNECRTPQRAAELLRTSVELAEDDIRVRGIAQRLKERIEQERAASKATIEQYAEQVERLTNEIADLTAELEDKRIQLAQYGDLDALISRLGVQVVRLERTDKPAECKQLPEPIPEPAPPEPPPKPEKKLSQKTDSKKKKGKADGFDDFWTVYPKKVDKQTARALWDKLAPDNEFKKVIIAAVKRQSQSEEWRKDNGQFVPYPSTWLRRRRWEDEPTPPTVAESGDGVHSYDVNKILQHSKDKLKGGT